MPDRIAQTIVLVEDVTQQNLVRRYLERVRGRSYSGRQVAWLPLPAGSGSGEQYVRHQYARQVQACRSTLGRRASCLLIVVIDADTHSVADRARQLAAELSARDLPPRNPTEPVVVLIPKRHVETWIHALLGESVDEDTDYTRAPYIPPGKGEIRQAASELFAWTRPNADSGPTCPPSLRAAIPEWAKVTG